MASLIPPGAKSVRAELFETNWNGLERHRVDFGDFYGEAAEQDLIDWVYPLIREQLTDDRVECSDPVPTCFGYRVATIWSTNTGYPVANLRITEHRAGREIISYPAVDLSVRREDLPRIDEAA